MSNLREALWILLISLLVPGNDGTATPSFIAAYENNITVSPNGSDNQTCLNGEIPCQTLSYPLQPGNLKNSTKVTILSGSYNLSTASFAWLEDFALFGASGDIAGSRIRCETGAGLSFRKSKNLLFRGLVFEGCGSLHESTTGNAWTNFARAKFKAGLFLAACSNLSVQNCTFRNSPGIAVNLYDVGGIVDFSHSWFERNGPDTREGNYTIGIAEAGGGLYIEFTSQGYDASGMNFPVKNSDYSVSDCHFIQNHAPQPRYENYTVMNITGNRHSPFGRGGGISVFLMGTTEGNTVLIDGCVFQENIASWGGGVFYELHEQAQNTSLKIRNSMFLKNWVRFGGGGTRTGSSTIENSRVLKANKIFYQNCTFIENRAIFGGGVSHYGPTYLPANNDDQRQVYFIDCIWNGNRATAGSALGLNVLSESQIRVHPLVPFYVTLEMCSIQNNRIIQTEDFVVNGYGALYTNAAHLIFKDGVTFENNTNMTALLLDNAFVYVHNKTVFRNNSGEFGGAIALYGESRIITWDGSELLFENNHARGMGGAIYVRAPGPPMAPFKTRYLAIHECFLAFEGLTQHEVEQWNTKITFKNNKASEGAGNSVYATTLQSCYKQNETRENNHALHWPNVVNFSASSTSEISTDPVFIKIVQHDWQNLSPSQLFNVSVKLTDERNQRSPAGAVEITIKQQELDCDVKLDVPSSFFIVQENGQICGLKFTGPLGCGFTVQLKSPPGQQFLQPAPFSVRLRKRCHAGFEIGDDNKTCKCMSKLHHRGISRCGEDRKSVYLKNGYWFGKVGKTERYDTYPCPKNYCNKKFMSTEYTECHGEDLSDEFLYDNATMCAETRSGTLCGSCKQGYAVDLGDEVCVPTCSKSNMWVFGCAFFIGALVIVLFLLLIPHLDIFASYLNAILFSFQVMDVLIIERGRLDPVITGVISVAHWKSPTPGFPLFSGMTNLTKLGINYVLPAYILLLLLVLMFVTKCRRNVYFGENVFPAFCALIVLCYTNVTDITFHIFDYVRLGGKSVLFLDGDIDFHEDWKEHLPLTVTASLWLVFILLVPLILLLRPGCIERRRSCRFLLNICNAFSRCYKEGYEGFAAFYFICRIILIVLSTFLPLGDFLPMRRSILEASTILMVVILVCIRPYHDDFSVLNKTDAFLLVNLSFITIFSTTLVISSSKEVHCVAWFIVDVLCWFPVAVLLFLVIRYRRTLSEKWQQLKTWISDRLPACCNCSCGDEEEDSSILEEPTSTSA